MPAESFLAGWDRRRALRWVVATAYALVLAWATLNPSAGPASESVGLLRGVVEALGGPPWLADAAEPLANVAIFVPLPLLAASLGASFPVRAWLLLGLLASGSIEFLQRVALDGRSPTLIDIVTNTSGAVLGALLACWVRHLRARRPVPSLAYVDTRGN